MSQNTSLIPWNDLTSLPDFFEEFQDDNDLDNLGLGISTGFAVVSFRGKEWRVKYQGEETLLRDPKTGDGTRRLNCVIVGVSPAVSKTFYASGYAPGATEAPDCASANGIRPDAGVPDPQNDLCASCPNNVFGSRLTDNGSKAKACADHKRLAVVPANDVKNEQFGGAMLLRIPPASLQNLVLYMQQLKKFRCPPFACVTEISFDPEQEYPALILRPLMAIANRDILESILDVKRSMTTDTILAAQSMASGSPAQIAGPATKPVAQIGQSPARKAPPAPVEEAQTEEPEQTAEPEPDLDDIMSRAVSAGAAAAAAPAQPVRRGPGKGKPLNGGSKPAAAAKPAETLDAGSENALQGLLGGLLGGLS